MDKSKAVEELIDGLVTDLASLVRRVALGAMKSAVIGAPPVPKTSTFGSSASTLPTTGTAVGSLELSEALPFSQHQVVARTKPVAGSEPLADFPTEATAAVATKETASAMPTAADGSVASPPRRVARHPRLIAVPAQDATAAKIREAVADAQAASLGSTAFPEGPERDGMVLSAVRALVRPTASEVAGHCHLATQAAHASLRTLVASGQIARSETARGQEYSLVSPGAVRPFKRSKNGPPGADAGPPAADAPTSALNLGSVEGPTALAR